MEIIKHETCQQYVTRRLDEGWSIVWQKGNYLILSSPDGNVLRPVDLRNDVETLRPNEAGDETTIPTQFPDSGEHWEKVDEAVADEDDTYLRADYPGGGADLYKLPASSGSGTINFIKIYLRLKIVGGGDAYPKLKSNSTVTNGDHIDPTTSWVTYSQQWNDNPADSEAWEWADIDTLQIGLSLYTVGSRDDAFCTQVYVEVDYTPITPKTSSDTGSGADAKASGNPMATFPVRSETGGGVDGHKAVAPQSAGETGLGTDAKLSLAVALIKADAGSGLEHILDRALVLTEVGSGVDTVLALLGKIVSDSGTGVENSYLHILEGVKSSSDSGSGAEASSLAALFQRDETGEGVESVVARALYAREYPTGALDLAKVITAAITGAETGTGAEASLVSFYQKKTDSGSGADVSSLVALFTGEDSGAGAEAITLLAAMVSHDTGVGVEAVIDFFRKLIDSGQGEENLHLIGYVGRAMKLVTYLRDYSDLVVYTKPYSDLRVYNAEVKQV